MFVFWVGFLLWFVIVCVFTFFLEPPGLKNPERLTSWLVVEFNPFEQQNLVKLERIPPIFGGESTQKDLETTN